MGHYKHGPTFYRGAQQQQESGVDRAQEITTQGIRDSFSSLPPISVGPSHWLHTTGRQRAREPIEGIRTGQPRGAEKGMDGTPGGAAQMWGSQVNGMF